jgi:hypothetical protein
VAAAFHQQSFLHGGAHGLAEIDARDRSARTGADATRLQRDRKSGTREFFLQPRSDETDHARMPAFRRRDDHGAFVFKSKRSQRFGFGLRLRHLFDGAALGIQSVKFSRDPGGFGNVAFEQQPHAEIGAPDPPAGIDARPEHESEMPGFRRTVEPRDIHQGGMTDVIAAAHCDQAFRHESAIEPGQRRDIGDGAERDVVQHAQQIRLGHFAGPESARPQFAIDRDQRDQHESNRGEMAEPGKVIEPVRIHQGVDFRQLVAALMMIDDDDRHSQASRFSQRLEARGAAIHRHEQRSALARKHADGFDIGAIAFENPVGNMNQRIEPAMAQMPCQKRRRRCAVDVVIAENRDHFVSRCRVRDAFRGNFHLRHMMRIGHQFANRRIEKILDRINLDITSRQHPRQHLRQLMTLRDRKRARRPS